MLRPCPLVVVAMSMLATGCAAPRPEIVAHRGASWDAPENTIASFRDAWTEGADAVEGDFRLSADGVIVCLHDETTERTAGSASVVAETRAEALRRLDVGAWKGEVFAGQRVPTLAEVLATVPEGRRVVIELKAGPEIVPPLAEALATSPVPRSHLTIISFDRGVIIAAGDAMPDVRRLWLSDFEEADDGGWAPGVEELVAGAREIGAHGLSVRAADAVDEPFVARVRAAGLELHVWTVNDAKTARRMGRLRVDSITTDRPRFVREALRELNPRPTKPPLAGPYPFGCR